MTKDELEKKVLELEQRLLLIINGNIKIMARLEEAENTLLRIQDKNLSLYLDFNRMVQVINEMKNNTTKTDKQ